MKFTFSIDLLIVIVVQVVLLDLLLIIQVLIIVISITVLLFLCFFSIVRLFLEIDKNGKWVSNLLFHRKVTILRDIIDFPISILM